MKRKRGHLEIARDILEVAKEGDRPTALVYKSNLNFNVIKRYLSEMEEAGLIIVEAVKVGGSRTRLYHTTEKGMSFIESLSRTLEIYYSPVPIGQALPEIIQAVP